MADFDLREQTVSRDQYNIKGNLTITHHADKDEVSIPATLQSLIKEVDQLTRDGIIPRASSIDIEAHLKKAILFSEDDKPDKSAILTALEAVKKLCGSASSVIGFINSVSKAIQSVSTLL